jgi:hypothetical protein
MLMPSFCKANMTDQSTRYASLPPPVHARPQALSPTPATFSTRWAELGRVPSPPRAALGRGEQRTHDQHRTNPSPPALTADRHIARKTTTTTLSLRSSRCVALASRMAASGAGEDPPRAASRRSAKCIYAGLPGDQPQVHCPNVDQQILPQQAKERPEEQDYSTIPILRAFSKRCSCRTRTVDRG